MKPTLLTATLGAILFLSSCQKQGVEIRTGLASLTDPKADNYLVFIEKSTNKADTVIFQNTSGDRLFSSIGSYNSNGKTYKNAGFSFSPKIVKRFKSVQLMYGREVPTGTTVNKCAVPSELIVPGHQTLTDNYLFWTIFDSDNYMLGTGPNHSNPPFDITSVTTIPAKSGTGCDTTLIQGKLSKMAFKNDNCPIVPYYFSEAVFQVKLVGK